MKRRRIRKRVREQVKKGRENVKLLFCRFFVYYSRSTNLNESIDQKLEGRKLFDYDDGVRSQ